MKNNKYFTKWDSRSSIRSRPFKYVDFNINGYFSPPTK